MGRSAALTVHTGVGKPQPTTAPTPNSQISAELTRGSAFPNQKTLQSELMLTPLIFEPNRGQVADGSQYVAQSGAYGIHFFRNAAQLQVPDASGTHTLDIAISGANPNTRVESARLVVGKSNYYMGSDKSTWLTGIPNYAALHYDQIYPGVDLVFYGNRGRLEYDFVLSPRVDPQVIGLQIPAGVPAKIAASGDLDLQLDGQSIELLKPVVYQYEGKSAERKEVEGHYRLLAGNNGTMVKFEIGDYDSSRPLIIDPVLLFSQPAPGTEQIRGIQVDGSGNIYIAGENPNTGALQVTKLAADASTVLYTTNVATSYPQVDGFAVDSSGRAYVVAFASSGLPTTSSAYQGSVSSGAHVYFAALDTTGSITYATYIAGSSTDYSEGLAADPTGKAYIFGETCSTDFPRTTGATPNGCYSPFVLKMDPSQSGAASLVYSNILAVSNAYALEGAVDASNNLYVAVQSNGGGTLVPTPGAFQYLGTGSPNGVYAEKLDPSGNPVYVAYLGPGNPYGIAVEGTGAVYVAGRPGSYNFPTTAGAFDTNYPGGFLAKLSSDGSTLLYSTFLSGPSGTPSNFAVTSLTVVPGCMSSCNAYFGGYTSTSDMPVQNPIQNVSLTAGYNTDFFGEMNAAGSQALFLSYFGGSNSSYPSCADDSTCSPYVTTDASGNIYAAGFDYSSDFPLTSGQNTYYNYIAKIGPGNTSLALAIPSAVNFPYSQPVGVPTAHVPTSNYYVNPNQIVTFRNMGSAAITFSGIGFLGTDFSETDNCNPTIPAGGTCQIQVQFDPIHSGLRTDTMTINTSAPNGPTAVQVSGTAVNTAVLELPTTELDFGGVNVGTASAAQTFTLNNVGNTPMQFYGFYLSGPFVETDNCPSQILVGTSCTVTVTFNPATAGYVTGSISVSTSGNYYLSSPTVTLTGTGIGVGTPSLLISPTSLNFPPTNMGSVSPTNNDYNIIVQNTGNAPLGLVSFSITGDFKLSSNGCGSLSLQPSQYCYLRVQFAPTAVGTRTGTLSVFNSLSTTPQTVSLTGVGSTGTQSIVLSTSNLTWPDQPVGTISSTYYQSQYIQVTNTGSLPVAIYRAYNDNADFHIVSDGCSGSNLTPGNYCNLYVEFAPTQVGTRTGTITLIDNAPDSPQTVSMSGNGLTATQGAVLNPTTAVFLDQVINTTSSGQYVYLYNSGNTPIAVTNVQSDNAAEFAIVGGCTAPYSIPPGSNCYAYVRFTPSAAGSRSAHIIFTDSAPGSPHSALVTGLGLSPTGALEVNPSSIPFGSQPTMVSTSTVQVHVHNPGNSGVILTGVTPSMADYVISSNSCTGTLSPSSDCYFYVAFDPTTTGTRNGSITITASNATSQGVTVEGAGVTASKSLLVIAPSTMDWGTVAMNTSHQRHIFLRNIGTQTITFSSIGGLSAPFSLSNGCGTTLAINTACDVYLTYNPTATGPTTETLSITSDAAGSPQSLTLIGNAAATASGLVFDQNGLQFDQVPTGLSSPANQQYMYLSNYTGGSVTFGSPTVSSGFTLGNSSCPTGGTIGNGGNCYYYVQAAPNTTGIYSGTLMVNVQGVNVSAPLTAYGVTPQPTVDLSQDGMLFPDQVVGNTSGVQYVYVYNVGNSPLTFNASSLGSSTDFIIQNDYCGGSFSSNPLQPNNYCYVGLQFKPGSATNLMATLTINDSAGGHTVMLEGTGLTPLSTVEIQPAGIAFLNTTVGLSSSQQYAYLYNTGNVPVTFSANAQVCTTTGNPCTASPDFALGSSGGYCNASNTVGAGSYCYQYVVFSPQSAGAKTAVLRFNDSASNAPHYLQLSGTAISPITSAVAGRNQWSFPDTAIGASSNSDYIYVTNTGNTPITFSALMSSSTEFVLSSNSCASYVSNPLQPGQQCYTYLTFTPTGTPGPRNATLTIPTSAGMLSVALKGNAVAGSNTIMVESTDVEFGQVPVGFQAYQYLYITNTGTLPVTMGTPTIAPTGEVTISSGCSGTLYPGSTCYIYVYMTPSASGQRSATITYNDNASGSPHQITVNATGISNQVSLSQTNLDFGSIAMGAQSPTVSVYYTNQTNAAVTISSVTLGGTNASDFVLYTNSCGGGVGANSYCYIQAYFKPMGTSTRSANITFVDSTGVNQVVNLTGTGLTPFPIASVFPSQIVFASQPLNMTSSSQTITVTNKGTANLTFTGFTLTQPASDFAIQYNYCQSATLQTNQGCNIYLTFTPSAAGSSPASLSIADNDSGSPQVINITGYGQAGADLALSGNVTPRSAPPGGTATFTVVATNNGPFAANNVSFTMSAPTNASVQSITPSAGITCNGTTSVSCTLASMSAGASFNIVEVVQNTTAGPMTTNVSISSATGDPNPLNNTLTLTSDSSIADLQVAAASAATTLNGQPAFTMSIANRGPGSATNVNATFDLNQFGYSSYSSSQGSCAWNGVQVTCTLGTINSGGAANVTIAVLPPSSGWSSIEAHATADQYDPVPTNNLAQVTINPEGYNTKLGTNVSVDTQDPLSGATANVLFPSVTRPGVTALASAIAPPAPSGFRLPRAPESFDVTSSAQFGGNLTVTLRFAPSAFWHPSEAHLFHNENGVWVDRTSAVNPAGSVAAVTSSLSQFALFEPPDQPPVANPGAAMILSGTNATGNQVQLNGSQSNDPENDSLTYKWTGPFPEGGGAVTGANPTVTLPVGVSQVTLVVNDGEVDSASVTQSVTVSDFTVASNMSAISVTRGQTANLTLALTPKFASYDKPVALACANLPADLTCQFAETSAMPGANGSSVTLTIAASQTAALSQHGSPRALAAWLLAMGMPFGFVLITGDRKRLLARLGVLAIVLLALYMAGCGSSSNTFQTQTQQAPPTSSTSTITVTGTSGTIQHSITLSVTRN